jgi:hypothetical protein
MIFIQKYIGDKILSFPKEKYFYVYSQNLFYFLIEI